VTNVPRTQEKDGCLPRDQDEPLERRYDEILEHGREKLASGPGCGPDLEIREGLESHMKPMVGPVERDSVRTIEVSDADSDTSGFFLETWSGPYRCVRNSTQPALRSDSRCSYNEACEFLRLNGYRTVSEFVGTGWGGNRTRWVKGDFVYCALAPSFGAQQIGNDFTLRADRGCLIEDDPEDPRIRELLSFEDGCAFLTQRGFTVSAEGTKDGVTWVRLVKRRRVDLSGADAAEYELRSDELYQVVHAAEREARLHSDVGYWEACQILESTGWHCIEAQTPLHIKDDSQWVHVREQFTSKWIRALPSGAARAEPADWRNREEEIMD
jgi:hypothetical protein